MIVMRWHCVAVVTAAASTTMAVVVFATAMTTAAAAYVPPPPRPHRSCRMQRMHGRRMPPPPFAPPSSAGDAVASPSVSVLFGTGAGASEGEGGAEAAALLAELSEIDRQKAELLGGVGGAPEAAAGDGAAARSEMRRTAEHLDRLRRMTDPGASSAAPSAEAGGADSASDPHAAERRRLFEEFRMRPANDLKEELRKLRLKATGRKPDLARRLADHYVAKRSRGSGRTPEDNAEEGKVETVPAEQVRTDAADAADGLDDDDSIDPLTQFAGLASLSPVAGLALSRANFLAPSPIQSAAVPAIADGTSCILHAETGSGKTLAYLLPVTELLWKEFNMGLTHPVEDGVGYCVVLTPTRELAAQVAGVATVLAPPGSVRLVGRPSDLMGDGKAERGELKYGGRPTDDITGGTSSSRVFPRLLVGSAKSIATSLFGNDKMPAPPTSKPEAKTLLRNVRWLILDEVDRLLNVKKTRSERAYKRHEKPAAMLASAAVRHTLGNVQVVAASATVGRPLRRELARVLGLTPQECPAVVRGRSGEDGDAATSGEGGGRFADITRGGSGSSSGGGAGGSGSGHLGRAVTVPPTVRNYVLPCMGESSGSLLTAAGSIIQSLPPLPPPQREGGRRRRGRRTLLVLSRGCGLNVKTALGALRHFNVKPAPRSLIDVLEADGTDRLIEVHREVSGATGVGQSKVGPMASSESDVTNNGTPRGEDEGEEDEGYLLVTGEDSVRGLHLDNLDTVLVVGRPAGPDEYTHIAGRTGRAGREGTVINVVGYEQAQALTSWEKMLGVDFVPLDESEVPDLN